MSQHLLRLTPADVLFFRDGRPMEGSSAGHGAAWPLPHVLDSALHHALRRAGHEDLHPHTPKRSGRELNPDRETHGRQFGSLQSAGPFPVNSCGQWFFPRPADADEAHNSLTTHRPLESIPPHSASSLPSRLRAVVSTRPPSKDKAEKWLSAEAYQAYLNGTTAPAEAHYLRDDSIFSAEHNIGIGISPETGTQDGERFYSASWLRLTRDFHLGLIASCMDKGKTGKEPTLDLIGSTFPNSGHRTSILAGGQQRTCTVQRPSGEACPLPSGPEITGTRVRWTLLTPAIFPHLPVSDQNPTEHPGGWLPSWIEPGSLTVQLKDPTASKRENREGRETWRRRVKELSPIQAKLVAALIPRALPVTGWALTDTNNESGALDQPGGARATHLAVPAGAVYYFECGSETAAIQLAAALNWHGGPLSSSVPAPGKAAPGATPVIQNRRSALLGEKGYGLGVCSTWHPHPSA